MRALLLMWVLVWSVGSGVGCVSLHDPAPHPSPRASVEVLKARVASLETRHKWLKNQFKAQEGSLEASCPAGYEFEGAAAGRVLCTRKVVIGPGRAPFGGEPALWQPKPSIWPSGCSRIPLGDAGSCERRPIRVWSSVARR